jgi:hypothetical protein
MTTLSIFFDEETKNVIVRMTEHVSEKKIHVSEFNTNNIMAIDQMIDNLKMVKNTLIENNSVENIQKMLMW